MSLPSLLRKVSPLSRELIVGGVILVAVVASRHLTLDYPLELSADESELLVQIDRYEHDLMPWRSVDGSTIGPVNPWFLLLVKQTGWPMTYSGLHFLAALLLGAIVVVSYYTVRLILPFRAALLVGLAGVITLTGSASINFMYYATELLPVLALALAGFGLVWTRRERPAAPGLLVLAAVCSGLAPWAKLQAAPVSLLLVGFTAWAGGDPGRAAADRGGSARGLRGRVAHHHDPGYRLARGCFPGFLGLLHHRQPGLCRQLHPRRRGCAPDAIAPVQRAQRRASPPWPCSAWSNPA